MTRCANSAACHNPCLAGCDDPKGLTDRERMKDAATKIQLYREDPEMKDSLLKEAIELLIGGETEK